LGKSAVAKRESDAAHRGGGFVFVGVGGLLGGYGKGRQEKMREGVEDHCYDSAKTRGSDVT